MNIGSKIGRWLVEHFGDRPAQPAASRASTETPQPAQIYVREVPKTPVSRKTVLAAGALFLVAAWLSTTAFRQPAAATITPELATAGVDKSRIQRIIDDLSRKNADLALQQEEVKQQMQSQPQPPGPYPGIGRPIEPGVSPAKAQNDERREHAYKSLFASPVVTVRADTDAQPRPPEVLAQALAPPAPIESPPPPAITESPRLPPESSPDCADVDAAERHLYALCEGSIIEARLENRLVGDFAGPVNATVEREVYSRDHQHLLIPKGTRLLGKAAMADRAFQERLSVQFHRMILPNGRGVALRNAVGLDQAGEIALKDKTNRHLPATVATTVALGSLGAFSQFGTGGYLNGNGLDMYRQSLATQAGQTGQQIIGRNLNRPPSITIREGHPVEIYLNADIHLPEFQPAVDLKFGGR